MMKFVRKMLFLFLLGAILIPAGSAGKAAPKDQSAKIQCPSCKEEVRVPREFRRKKKKKSKKKKKKGKKDKKDKKDKAAPKGFNCPKCKKEIPYPPAEAKGVAKKQAPEAGNDDDAGNDAGGED